MIGLIKDIFSPTNTKDGYEELVTMDCIKTNNPNKYAEGVYLWRTYSEGLSGSAEYHQSRNGDPQVWVAWFSKNKDKLNL